MEQFVDPEIMRGCGHWEEYVWVPGPQLERFMTNQTIADYIDAKYSAIAALRQARKEMFEAFALKAQAECQSEYQMALDRKAKL